MADAAKFRIDGVEYAFPDLVTITLDEAIVLYEHSGLTLDQVEEVGDKFHPGLIKGLLAIAVRRARPSATNKEIAKRLGEMTIVELGEMFTAREEPDDRPLDRQNASDVKSSSSGASSENAGGSSPDQSPPVSTGQPDSDTGATSAPETLAA